MTPIFPLLLLSGALAIGLAAPPAQAQERQCWFDAMTEAQKRAMVLDYARIKQAEGPARAKAWAQEQRAAYVRQAAAKGLCPAGTPSREPAAPPRVQADRPLNRHGQPCKRLELENQNVPNIGGSMGWALIQVCKDD